MPSDTAPSPAYDTAEWPSPSPEDVVRARVGRRTRRLRLRRTVPLAGAPLAVVLAAVLALPNAPMRLSTEQRPAGGDRVEASGMTSTTTTTGSTTTTTASDQIVVSDDPRVQVWNPTPERVTAPGVASVPVAPKPPVYSTGHPLLTDPRGDAVKPYTTEPSDPAWDLTGMDITADDTGVKVTVTVPDIRLDPQPSPSYGTPEDRDVLGIFNYGAGVFEFRWNESLPDGTRTYRAGFSQPAGAPGVVSTGGTSRDFPTTATVDLATGVVTFRATYADMNAAMAGAEPPIGRGAEVRPRAWAGVSYSNRIGATDEAKGPAGYTYRLGD